MRKVLLISPLPPPLGGIATWSKYVIDFFEKSSKFEVVNFNNAIQKRRITQNSLFQRILIGTMQIVMQMPHILKKVKTVNPNIIHITSSASIGLIRDLFILLFIQNRKYFKIIHFHFGRIPDLEITKNWEWKLLLIVIKFADKVIVIDNKSYNVLIKHNIINCVYLPNPLAPEIEKLERSVEVKFEDRLFGTVLFVGLAVKEKGIIELVSACSLLKNVIELIIIGPIEIQIKDELLKIAKQRLDGQWLSIKGSQSSEFVLSSMKRCNVFVLPSYTEGFPYVILEAMVSACPIIVTNVGAIEEMLEVSSVEPSAIIVKPRDMISLKNSIDYLISNKLYSKKLGSNAKSRVLNEYNSKKIYGNIECIWSNQF